LDDGLDDAVYGENRIACSSWIGGIGFDEKRRSLASQKLMSESGGDIYHEQDLSAFKRFATSSFAGQFADDLEVIRVLQCPDEAAGDVGAVGADDGGIEVLGVGVDGVAEERHLDDGDADDHGEGDAVAAKLQKLLADDAPPASDREKAVAGHAWPPKLSAERLII
jgi:hypothetical protein